MVPLTKVYYEVYRFQYLYHIYANGNTDISDIIFRNVQIPKISCTEKPSITSNSLIYFMVLESILNNYCNFCTELLRLRLNSINDCFYNQ